VQNILKQMVLTNDLEFHGNSIRCVTAQVTIDIRFETIACLVQLVSWGIQILLSGFDRVLCFSFVVWTYTTDLTRRGRLRTVRAMISALEDKLQRLPQEQVGSQCSVCGRAMHVDEAKMLPCRHCFHLECLFRCVEGSPNCPSCGADLENMPAPVQAYDFAPLFGDPELERTSNAERLDKLVQLEEQLEGLVDRLQPIIDEVEEELRIARAEELRAAEANQ
jgi:hypothetical protein